MKNYSTTYLVKKIKLFETQDDEQNLHNDLFTSNLLNAPIVLVLGIMNISHDLCSRV